MQKKSGILESGLDAIPLFLLDNLIINYFVTEADNETKELPWWRYNPGKVIFNKFAIKLMHPVAKTCVILITAFILGFGIYGLTQLDQKFNPAWFLPPGTFLCTFFRLRAALNNLITLLFALK